MINPLMNYFYHIGIEAQQKRLKNILDIVPEKKNAIYLDCGSYDGVQTVKIAEKIKTKKMYGIDRDPQLIKKAEAKGIKVSKGDLNKKIPFSDNTFDIITAIEVIEHIYDTDAFVHELKRVCKKNGYIFVGTENLAAWHNIFALLLGFQPSAGPHVSAYFPVGFHPLLNKHGNDEKEMEIWNSDRHINVMTRDALRKLFLSYGFAIDDERNSGFYPFSGKLAALLATIDRTHALTVLLKLRKIS
jgi:ubiquinone/menaquinone biosynthesis C-methylase UbiE